MIEVQEFLVVLACLGESEKTSHFHFVFGVVEVEYRPERDLASVLVEGVV
jgi:hypothetical protein